MERIWQEKKCYFPTLNLLRPNILTMEIHLNDRIAKVNILDFDGTYLKAEVDGKIYELDYARIGGGTYSFIFEGKAFELEVSKTSKSKVFEILNSCHIFKTEIVDAEARYQKNRSQSDADSDETTISSPMPGKVVKIPVKAGDKVKAGQILIIVSAMKMESEYKTKIDGIVKEVLVSEEDTIDGDQVLIVLD